MARPVDVRFNGPAFREAREAAGLSTTQLAASSGVREGTIENWEAGRVLPRTNLLIAACEVLKRDPMDFCIVKRSRVTP